MSILEQTTFIKEIHPFENLTKAQLEVFAQNLDIIYLKKNEVLQKQGSEPKNLYFIIKGLVQEKSGDEVLSIFSSNEVFDSISLIENYSKNTFITAQETILYSLPREIFIKTLHENSSFREFLFSINFTKIKCQYGQ